MYSALACDLLEKLQWRKTLPPKNARNDRLSGIPPWLNTKQTNASTSAAPWHRLAWGEGAND